MKKAASLIEACNRVVGKMKGVMTTGEIVEAVSKLYPTKAKDPSISIMKIVRSRNDVIELGKGKYARADQIAEGAKFRIVIAGDDLILGVVKGHYFKPFDLLMKSTDCEFVAGDKTTIPVARKPLELGKLDDQQLMDTLFALGEEAPARAFPPQLMEGLQSFLSSESDDEDEDDWDEDEFDEDEFDDEDDGEFDEDLLLKGTLNLIRQKIEESGVPEMEFHDFSDYFQRVGAKAGDSLIVTVHPDRKRFVFEHEPANRARRDFIEEHDEVIRRLFHAAIKSKKRARIGEIIFRAYATLPWMKEYPCHHWFDIVEQDDDLRIIRVMGDNWEIAPIDYSMPMDLLGMDLSTVRKLEKRYEALEQEAEEFYERMESTIAARMEKLKPHEVGGPGNVIKKPRLGRDDDSIMNHDFDLIDKFSEAEPKRGRDTAARQIKQSAIEQLAEFLVETREIPLEYATADDLGEFIFDWYPENGIFSAPEGIKRMIEGLRDFYQYLAKAGIIRSAAFAEAFYVLRDLAAENVEYLQRMPPGPSPF